MANPFRVFDVKRVALLVKKKRKKKKRKEKKRDIPDLKLNTNSCFGAFWLLVHVEGHRAGLVPDQQIGIRGYPPVTLFAYHAYGTRSLSNTPDHTYTIRVDIWQGQTVQWISEHWKWSPWLDTARKLHTGKVHNAKEMKVMSISITLGTHSHELIEEKKHESTRTIESTVAAKATLPRVLTRPSGYTDIQPKTGWRVMT